MIDDNTAGAVSRRPELGRQLGSLSLAFSSAQNNDMRAVIFWYDS